MLLADNGMSTGEGTDKVEERTVGFDKTFLDIFLCGSTLPYLFSAEKSGRTRLGWVNVRDYTLKSFYESFPEIVFLFFAFNFLR